MIQIPESYGSEDEDEEEEPYEYAEAYGSHDRPCNKEDEAAEKKAEKRTSSNFEERAHEEFVMIQKEHLFDDGQMSSV